MAERNLVEKSVLETDKLLTFVVMTRNAILSACEAEEMVDIRREIASLIKKDDPFPTEESLKSARDHAAQEAKYAKSETESGFPYLYSLATVRLWSIVEAAIDDEALAIIDEMDMANPPEALRRLKGSLIPFLHLSKDQQNEYLLSQLKDSLSSQFKSGIGAFESVLEALGFGGAVDAEVRKALFECSQVRNVIVHRAGVIDRRLCEACPWLEMSPGNQLKVSHADFVVYVYAAFLYLLEVEVRILGDKKTQERASDHAELTVRFGGSFKKALSGRVKG